MGGQARAVKAQFHLTDQAITDFDLYLFGEGRHERDAYGVARPGSYQKIFDSDDARFGGSCYNQQRQAMASDEGAQGYPCSLRLNLPPLGAMFFVGSDCR
jgi:hypothetical protein